MTATVPQLIAELRAHIVRLTNRPIDPDLDRLTTEIELLSAVQPLPCSELDLWELTKTERRLFEALAKVPGHTFHKDALMNAVYYDAHGCREVPPDKIIDIYVHKLRKKLAKADAHQWVETVWGIGYRLVPKRARDMLDTIQFATKDRSAWYRT